MGKFCHRPISKTHCAIGSRRSYGNDERDQVVDGHDRWDARTKVDCGARRAEDHRGFVHRRHDLSSAPPPPPAMVQQTRWLWAKAGSTFQPADFVMSSASDIGNDVDGVRRRHLAEVA